MYTDGLISVITYAAQQQCNKDKGGNLLVDWNVQYLKHPNGEG